MAGAISPTRGISSAVTWRLAGRSPTTPPDWRTMEGPRVEFPDPSPPDRGRSARFCVGDVVPARGRSCGLGGGAGERARAWRWHVMSLRPREGRRYRGYTRHLLKRPPAVPHPF